MHVSLFIFVTLLVRIHAEELLNSKFSYDEALLEKMIRNEIRLEQVQEEVRATLGRVESTLKDIQKTNQNMKEEFNHLNQTTLVNVGEFMNYSTGVIDQQKEEIGRMSEDLQSQYTNLRQNLTGEFNHLNQTTLVNVGEFMNYSTGVIDKQKEEIGRMSEDLQSQYTNLRQNLTGEFNHLSQTTFVNVGEFMKYSTGVIDKQKEEIGRMSEDLQSQYTNLTELISTPIIAFKATGIKNIRPSIGEVLVFPTVLFNAGNGYDASTGIFTAPEDGLYLFTTQICVQTNKFITANIMVEDMEVGRILTSDSSSTAPCNTGDAIVDVKASQKVSVKVKHHSANLYTDAYRLLSFSGALLHEGN